MKEDLLVITAGFVLLIIVFQLIKGFIRSKRNWASQDSLGLEPELQKYVDKAQDKPREVLREIDAKVLEQKPGVSASYYSTAGEIALVVLKRPSVAIRYYERALRVEPHCLVAFERLKEVLLTQKRIRRLERTCWSVLARLDEDDTGGKMWHACWSGLITVYSHHNRLTKRSDSIRKMLLGFEDNATDSEQDTENDDSCSCTSVSKITISKE